MSGTFTPAPGRAPMRTVLARHTRFEILLTARRGEALVLSMAVPIVAMLAAGLTHVINIPGTDRLGWVVPGALALTVMATALTGQAITVGYERFYGVLKRLGASPLSRTGLLASKTAAIFALVLVQSLVVAAVGVAAGWRPHPGHLAGALGVTLLATVAYSGIALVLASVLRPETTTASATLLYAVMLAAGGAIFPIPDLGGAGLLVPVAAHAQALRATLLDDRAVPAGCWLALALWAVVSVYAAARTFRWE
jgi:ABC-2 type transport system permease protein